LDVLLLDKAEFPRDKCCGDGLTAMALRLLEQLDFDPSSTPSWNRIDTVSLRSPSSRVSKISFPENRGQYAAVVRRFELDNELLNLAVAWGACFMHSTAIEEISNADNNSVRIRLSDGQEFTAAYMVAADGAFSPVRRLLGVAPVRLPSDWHAFRQYFPLNTDLHDIFVSFEADLLPAYLWVFPLGDGAANVGFGLHLGVLPHLGEMKSVWKDIQTRPHLQRVFGNEGLARLKAWPIPAHIQDTPLSHGRVLFAGDSAAASDALTGEGIGQALETGRLAARAVANGVLSRPDDVSGTYARDVRAALWSDSRWSRLLMRGLSHRRGARGGVRISGSNPRIGTLMARWMFEDFPRGQILNPITVLRSRPGAFR
jgi:flavin-dependent dehydrogenase